MQKDEEFLNATASEPLSLEEEYAMQEEWRVDPSSTFYRSIEDLLRCIFYFNKYKISRVDTIDCRMHIYCLGQVPAGYPWNWKPRRRYGRRRKFVLE